jgi:hypothetical protein
MSARLSSIESDKIQLKPLTRYDSKKDAIKNDGIVCVLKLPEIQQAIRNTLTREKQKNKAKEVQFQGYQIVKRRCVMLKFGEISTWQVY